MLFWKNNIKKLNKKVINDCDVPSLTVYSDASSSDLASIYKDKGKDKICKHFPFIEKTKSSTWRELEAIITKHKFQSNVIFWYTDNYATSVIVKKVSTKHIYTI